MRPQKVPTGEEDTLPHRRSTANIISKTLRGEVNDVFLFVRHRATVPEKEMLSPTRTGAVAKRNPDRTISEKMGIVSDLRMANLALRKEDLLPALIPTIQQIASQIVQLGRSFPDTEILACKRDIAKAPKLTPSNPYLVKCSRRVFQSGR